MATQEDIVERLKRQSSHWRSITGIDQLKILNTRQRVSESLPMHTPEMAGGGQIGVCAKCGLPPTPEGHDGCLGTLQGDVMNACCGHGNDSQAYIQYWDKSRISSNEAIAEQQRLIKE